MKEGVNSADIYVLARELQALVGGRFDKAYQSEDWLSFRFGVPGGKREVFVHPGKWVLLREMVERPETPPPFAAMLRKALDNARVTAVEQRGFDRILTFRLERGAKHDLVLEMFGKGNIVLARDGVIVAALRKQAFKDRQVAAGEPYAFPPGGVDPLALDAQGFLRTVRASKENLVKTLAARMNLGGQYSEELCARAGIDKSVKPKDAGESELAAVFAAWTELRDELERPKPAVILRAGFVLDVTPIPLREHAGLERQEFPSLGAALTAYLDRLASAPKPDPHVEKLRRRLQEQEQALQASRVEEVRSGMLADLVYAHYADFESLLKAARAGGTPEHPSILRVDRAKHRVVVRAGDVEEITLDYRRNVDENVQALYDARKEARVKAERVVRAMEDTAKELEKAVKAVAKAERKTRERPKPTKALWFEAYRWFVSSEGFLVLGGRDAKTNDSVVRKHLKEGDRYAHADVHGAPSCVIKEGARAGEATLREACAFAAAMSKAWSAGLASASAYWVLPEQVSKQAETGEYLPRGAFVVRGKRNYVHDIPLRLAVAEVEHEGHRKVMGAPEAAVAARSTRLAVITPGEGEREPLARRLAKAFQVPEAEIGRILPPGGSVVVEVRGLEMK
ncbi:MAG TPA: ribosome rescue protein RqcH [Thermoplasmata archaeon]|nr:ribosome rescue protein RqcH [Thermoplasmata archaeon]